MHRVVFTKQAHRALRKIPANAVAHIRKRLDQLAKDPYASHPNVTKLQNRPGFRLRVGDWRVIYEIRDDELVILVMKVGTRGEIYR